MSIKYDGGGIFKIFQVGKGSDCPSNEDFQSVHVAQYDLLLQDGKENAKYWMIKVEDMNYCLNDWKRRTIPTIQQHSAKSTGTSKATSQEQTAIKRER
eukprot:163312-Ditylum_brightwellii.AAC.1